MTKRHLLFPLVAGIVLSACSVASSDPAGSTDDALSWTVPSTRSSHNPWWKSQYDGTRCQDENCGPTAIAMLRNAVTGGASNHDGGWVRERINKYTGTTACTLTTTSEWADVLNETDGAGHWIDGKPKVHATRHCGDGFNADDLARAMSRGDVAIIVGRSRIVNHEWNQTAPCGYPDGHALFVGNWNGTTFSIYDPDSHNNPGSEKHADCGSNRTGYATTEWTKKELQDWSSGEVGSGQICAVTAPRLNDGPPAATVLSLTHGDDRRTTTTGDWSYGHAKAECGMDQAMTGLSISRSGYRTPRAVLCGAGDAANYPHEDCTVRDFSHGDDRAFFGTGDWDWGYAKGECGEHGYVAGVARNGADGAAASILCCPGKVNHNACTVHVITNGDSRETPDVGHDWDVGYAKGECGEGRYVAGVSATIRSGQHAILCCSP